MKRGTEEEKSFNRDLVQYHLKKVRCEEGTIQSVSISKKTYLDRNKCCQIDMFFLYIPENVKDVGLFFSPNSFSYSMFLLQVGG